MTTAQKILILGGVANLLYGALTGGILTLVRSRQATAPKYLVYAHIGPLLEAPILLGLAFAFGLSTLSASVENLAAALLVGSAFALDMGATVNWLSKTEDEFRTLGFGFALDVVSAVFLVPGLLILSVGVIKGA